MLVFAVINQEPPDWVTVLGVFANATDSAARKVLLSALYAGNKHFILSPADLLRPVATSYFQIACYYRCFGFLACSAGRPFYAWKRLKRWRSGPDVEKHELKITFFFFYCLASPAASLFECLPPRCEAAPLWRPYQSPSVDVIASHTSGGQGCEFRSRLMHHENQDLLLKLARRRVVHKYLTSPQRDRSQYRQFEPMHHRAVCHRRFNSVQLRVA